MGRKSDKEARKVEGQASHGVSGWACKEQQPSRMPPACCFPSLPLLLAMDGKTVGCERDRTWRFSLNPGLCRFQRDSSPSWGQDIAPSKVDTRLPAEEFDYSKFNTCSTLHISNVSTASTFHKCSIYLLLFFAKSVFKKGLQSPKAFDELTYKLFCIVKYISSQCK